MADVVTLDQVRSQLRFSETYTDDDAMLQDVYIPAADEVIRRECGDIIPKTYDEYYDGGDYSIWLRHAPILSVQLVEEGWGFTNYSLTEIQVNSASMPTMFAFSIDNPGQAEISRRSGGNVNIPFIRGNGNIHVIYDSGRQAIPGNIALAALQIIAFWYRGFLQQQSGADTYSSVDDDFPHSGNDIYTPQNLGVPMWLLELLKPQRRSPIIG